MLLTEERRARLLDEMMAFPDAEQFALFRKDYLDRYDADDEELARFAGEFIYTNLNGVFFQTDDFALAFDGLEELFYKRPIYDYYPAFWRRRPGSKTAVEFLFCLAAAYDFEKRVMAHLERAADEAGDVLGNRLGKKNVFNPKVKAYVLVKMRDALQAALNVRGIPSIEEAVVRMGAEERAIYDTLAGLGGDFRNRALFAQGRLDWDEGRIGAAFETWRQIEASFDHPAFLKIRPFLGRPDSAISDVVAAVTKALDEEAGPGSRQMLGRQHRFHKWKNRERMLEFTKD